MMYFLKRYQQIWQGPPPLFGQCPKESIFSLRRTSLSSAGQHHPLPPHPILELCKVYYGLICSADTKFYANFPPTRNDEFAFISLFHTNTNIDHIEDIPFWFLGTFWDWARTKQCQEHKIQMTKIWKSNYFYFWPKK